MQIQKTTVPAANGASTLLGHPSGLFVLSFSEMFERFSYYGMRSLLVLYMVSQLKYADERAYGIYGLYAALVYAAPLIGGYLADKVIGFKRAIVMGSLVIASGHLCMAMPFGEAFFYCGLGLIISGTGLFKSNVSALVGMLYKKEDPRRDAAYTLFYLGINAGGFLAPFVCGYIGTQYGWHYGFGLAGFGMILGALILLAKSHHFSYVETPPSSMRNLSNFTLMGGLLAGPLFAGMVYASETFTNILPIIGIAFLIYLLRVSLKSTPAERKNIMALLIAICLLLLSGALVEQSGMALTLFIERNVDRVLLGWTIPTAFFQSIDPFTVLIFGGLFSYLWMKLAVRGKDLETSIKYALGFGFIGLAYFIIYLGCMTGQQGDGVSPLIYAFAGMTFLSMGDICIYPVTLSLCSKLAPKRLEGVMMGGVMMGVSFSYLFGSILAKFASLPSDKMETIDLSESVLIYGDLFRNMALIAVVCIALTICIGLWMNKVTGDQRATVSA